MSDNTRRLGNYKPGDDGNLTNGDFQRLVNDVFLSAMRPHYELAAEEWKNERPKYMALARNHPGVSAYKIFRMEWLDEVERVERARSEHSVRRMLTVLAVPYTTAELKNLDTEAAEFEEIRTEALSHRGAVPLGRPLDRAALRCWHAGQTKGLAYERAQVGHEQGSRRTKRRLGSGRGAR